MKKSVLIRVVIMAGIAMVKKKPGKFGLAGKVILALGSIVSAASADNTERGAIIFKQNPPAFIAGEQVAFLHYAGATEDYDNPVEIVYPFDLYTDPVIDFYWATPFSPPDDKLMQEGRGLESMTTYTGHLTGRKLPGEGATTKLHSEYFWPENYEYKMPIADLYSRVNVGTDIDPNYVYEYEGSWDVKSWIKSGKRVPVTVYNTINFQSVDYPSHKFNVRFLDETDTNIIYVRADANRDGENNFKDFGKLARFWQNTAADYAGNPDALYDFYTTDTNGDDVINLYDLHNQHLAWLREGRDWPGN